MSEPAGLAVEELRAERDMLAYARRCLQAMRRRAESLPVLGGDAFAEEAAAWRRRRRIASRQRRAYASMSRSARSSSTARPAGSLTAGSTGSDGLK